MPIRKSVRWLKAAGKKTYGKVAASLQPKSRKNSPDKVLMRDIFLDGRLQQYYERFPMTLVDIGARGGIPRHWKLAENHLHVIGFEPDERSFRELPQQLGKTTILNTLLHSEKTSLRFHLTREEGDSSVFRPNYSFLKQFSRSERFDVVSVADVEADTLDGQLARHAIHGVHFIKADTQGSELFVLRGGTDALASSVFGVEVEVEFNPLYENQPLLADMDSFLRPFGFQLFDLRPVFWKRKVGEALRQAKGQIIYADALYLKDVASVRRDVERIADPMERVAKVLKCVSVCVLYGYFDYALDLADAHSDALGSQLTAVVARAIRHQDIGSRPLGGPRAFRHGICKGGGSVLGDVA